MLVPVCTSCRVSTFCAEPHEISLLYTLWYIKSAGGVGRISSTEGGAQERKLIGGTQQLPQGVARQLNSQYSCPLCMKPYPWNWKTKFMTLHFEIENNSLCGQKLCTLLHELDPTTAQKSRYPPGNHHTSHFKKKLFPGHNHLLATCTDDPTLGAPEIGHF